MHKIKPEVDIILSVLKETQTAYPASAFIKSLLFQYQERGGLSKKQLEGLHSKASDVKTIAPGKLATLEAIILKKPTRYKSELPVAAAEPGKDVRLQKIIDDILEKYPAHKRVLFFKMKFDNNEIIPAIEKAELERFHKLLIK
ncbi:MAG: hypothetical protein ABIN67_06405 [Ferruginibacter sp.]